MRLPDEDQLEERFRELLHHPRWSLAPRPDAEARARRAVRRQRLKAANATAATIAVVLAAVTIPMTLLPDSHTPPDPSPSFTPSSKPPPALTLPAVGAAGFPAAIYRPPSHHKVALNLVGVCPNPSGLQPPGWDTGNAAVTVIKRLGQGFQLDLRLTDRVIWPDLLSGWKPGGMPIFSPTPGYLSVLYSGPLESYHQAFGPPDMSHTIRTGCGSRTAHDTWMIVTGPVKDPGLQDEFLLLTRREHVLAWNAQ
jgi:hypothetical protein